MSHPLHPLTCRLKPRSASSYGSNEQQAVLQLSTRSKICVCHHVIAIDRGLLSFQLIPPHQVSDHGAQISVPDSDLSGKRLGNTCFRVGRCRHAAVPCCAIVAMYHGSAPHEWVKPWGLVENQPISPNLRHPVRFIELAFSRLAPRIARKRPSRLCRGSVYFGKP